jgi:transcriptional regulator with XRE-family HTH domain
MKKLKRGIAKIIVKRTGFSAAYVSDILTGKVKLDRWSTAKKIGAAANVDPVFLLEGRWPDVLGKIEKNIQPPEES